MGVNKNARPSVAPGNVTARIAKTSTSAIKLGMSTLAAVSMPLTPFETTKRAMAIAIACVRIAPGVEWKLSQKALGVAPGTSPVSVPTKKRIVHPMTTL